MTGDAWITLSVLAVVVIALMSNRIGIDVVMAGGLAVLMTLGVVDLKDAAAGFASPAVLMLGGLFVVAAGLERTGAIRLVAAKMLGKPTSVRMAQLRLMSPVALFSGFMSNTTVVAIGIPIVRDWARRLRMSPSALFLPLSFAAMLGGKLTLIGSASNLIIMGEYVEWAERQDSGVSGLSSEWMFFGIAAIGLPCCIVGIAFIALAARKLIPNRQPVRDLDDDARRYRTEVVIAADSPVIGRTIESADLRNLPGLFLSEIERDGMILAAVSPDEVLQSGRPTRIRRCARVGHRSSTDQGVGTGRSTGEETLGHCYTTATCGGCRVVQLSAGRSDRSCIAVSPPDTTPSSLQCTAKAGRSKRRSVTSGCVPATRCSWRRTTISSNRGGAVTSSFWCPRSKVNDPSDTIEPPLHWAFWR